MESRDRGRELAAIEASDWITSLEECSTWTGATSPMPAPCQPRPPAGSSLQLPPLQTAAALLILLQLSDSLTQSSNLSGFLLLEVVQLLENRAHLRQGPIHPGGDQNSISEPDMRAQL